MKKIIILSSIHLLLCIFSCRVYSQGEIQSLSCKFSQEIIYSNKTNNGLTFAVKNVKTEKIDTILKFPPAYTLQNCFCNDSMSILSINIYSELTIYILKKEAGKWESYPVVGLPIVFPNVGLVEEGKKYEMYSHSLTSIDQIYSKLTVYQANEKGELIEVEKYIVIYRIDLNPIENPIFKGSAKICKLFTLKKTLRYD
jgi:hypothetical protein